MSSDKKKTQRGFQELRYNVVLETNPVEAMEVGRLMQ